MGIILYEIIIFEVNKIEDKSPDYLKSRFWSLYNKYKAWRKYESLQNN